MHRPQSEAAGRTSAPAAKPANSASSPQPDRQPHRDGVTPEDTAGALAETGLTEPVCP